MFRLSLSTAAAALVALVADAARAAEPLLALAGGHNGCC